MPFLLQKKNTQPKGASGCNIQLVQSSLGTRRGQNKIIIFIYSIETKITCACCVNICVYLSYDCNDIDVMPVETCFWFVLLSGSKSAKVAYKGCYINLVTDAVTSFFKKFTFEKSLFVQNRMLQLKIFIVQCYSSLISWDMSDAKMI